MTRECILRVAIATPLRRLFDYLPPDSFDIKNLHLGIRVSVPFGRRKEVSGIIISIGDTSDFPLNKLKKINVVIDKHPILEKKHLNFLIWASKYYHYPIGEVVFSALPTWLRKNNAIELFRESVWSVTEKGIATDPNLISKSPKQAQILNFIQQSQTAVNESELNNNYPRAKQSLLALEKKELITKELLDPIEPAEKEIKINKSPFKLNKEQKSAIKEILNSLESSATFLLDGLTGSGKTEVYMSVMEPVIKAGRQCLVLLPEIGLTPQQIQRFKDRFEVDIAIQHSGLSETERTKHWQDAKTGKAKIILGTRSAVWTPLANPGLYIIDEEHDLSYKQQDSFRYSARDMLIIRATRDKRPAVLGSATPSLETLHNANKERYQHLILPARAGEAKPPTHRILDVRGKKMFGPLSQLLVDEIRTHLNNKNQVLLFLNRRGYASHLYCHHCGWKAECERCELPYTYHKYNNRMVCHHCDSNRRSIKHCPECEEELLFLGHGTERIEEVLAELFPKAIVARIDRDTTRKKNAMNEYLEKIHSGEIDILIGTQMLAKGHHFPNVTLTGIVDADRGLFSTDFRASERLAQLFMQVSGRTGRGSKEGTVVVQTHNPEHPLFKQLIEHGYNYFSKSLLQERKHASLPPHAYMAFLRAEAHNANDAKRFINDAIMQLNLLTQNALQLFGPIPALIEKRSGRYRYQLIIQSSSRKSLHSHLDQWLDKLDEMKTAKKVRWSIDIDPQDMT
ncbi:MAG TPA: primosomal protein N' [Thiotrichaceae bacterium]|jgi:primosomal protein N' (replication factor Y)|nr:primosomal protein N' [Thiotrichaceae bacterium]HIM08949.1 primosomal protein N' [Gammaproteobacteria bacterium]